MIKRKQKTLLVALILASGFAKAATVTKVPMDGLPEVRYAATHIRGLEIGGQTYDVDFRFGLYADLQSAGLFSYLGDEAGALEAVDAVINVLNDASVLFFYDETRQMNANTFRAPYEYNPSYDIYDDGELVPTVFAKVGYSYTQPGSQLVPGPWIEIDSATDAHMYAVFTPSQVVPIPAAVWLFGSALAGLGWMRRK
jgi:hypothetical protein